MPRLVTATLSNRIIDALASSPRKSRGCGVDSVMTAKITRIHRSSGMLRKPST
jgi:hypothetical protein